MRKVEVSLAVKLTIMLDDGIQLDDVINEMDYSFNSNDIVGASIIDEEIIDYNVKDSK